MTDKTLSIIVPSCNMERCLPKCLGSLVVASELMEKLEVLVVNDGSTDRTGEIARGFAAKWPQTFKVIDKANGHYGSCVNAAIPLATGRYVKLLDADDWFETEDFSEFVVQLDGACEDLVVTDHDIVDLAGVVTKHHAYAFAPGETMPVDALVQDKAYLPMHAMTYRTSLLREMDYRQLEGVSYTDTEWATIPLLRVKTVRYFPRVVYKYLMGRSGQSMEPKRLAASEWMRANVVLDVLRQFLRYGEGASAAVLAALSAQIMDELTRFYWRVIVYGGKDPINVDLERLDSELLSISETWHRDVGAAVYSRWLPYRYVAAWRKGSAFLPMMAVVCRLYSKIVMGFRS